MYGHRKPRRKKEPDSETRAFLARFRRALREAGLMRKQIADFSGVDPATVTKMLKGGHYNAQISTIIPLLRVAGYTLEFKEIEPKDDEFRSARRVPLPPVEDK